MVQQQILAQYPAADLVVTVIWMPMLPTDTRDEWDSQLLADPRVTHLWDPERTVGRWLADDQNADLGDTGEVVWDAYLLFGPEATWESALSEPLVWGAPIVGRVPELVDALAPLLEESAETAASLPEPDRRSTRDDLRRFVFVTQEERFHVISA